ncbi:MAG TPA: hypothetical protein VG759_03725 [Candidatus Angelobacter sp.]|jgi:hypothetical protein|nr:hypothetical protein [Candidatus Angelobacter sp.]
MNLSSNPNLGRKKKLPPEAPLEQLIHERDSDVLIAVAADARLTEDLALALLNRRDLPREALEEMNRNSAVAKQKKVRLAIVMHPRTPRHVSVPVIRHLYAFELMQVGLFPSVPADVKRAAEETLMGRLGTISSGERFALAKQCSGRVAAALLLDQEERIMRAALVNPQMTEAHIAKAVRAEEGTELLVAALCRHEKWSRRTDIKMALLANENTPLARVLQFANELPVELLKEVLLNSRLSDNVKNYLRSAIEERQPAKR